MKIEEKTVGRPFDTDLDTRILDTAKTLLAQKGFEGLTVTEIVDASGTTRAAFYRRYTDFADLMLDILTREFPTNLGRKFNTGTLPGDLKALQSDQLAFFSVPMINRSLSGFLGFIRSNEEKRLRFLESFLLPRRESTSAILYRALEREEIAPGYDSVFICDLLTGPFIFRVLVPELGPVNESLVDETVDAALQTLRYSWSSTDSMTGNNHDGIRKH